MRNEVRICGFGGQGVVMAGHVLGKAAAAYDGLTAIQTQSYGPEARGGAARSEVVIADRPIGYPRLLSANILVAMSQEAFRKFKTDLREDAVVIVDPDLVIDHEVDRKTYLVPATRIAEELGNKITANIVMVGALTAITRIVTREAMIQSVLESVPSRFRDLNQRAFEEGYRAGEAALAQEQSGTPTATEPAYA
jgi:2-oxoglutarate ferredoxin oxidoreductase subunit gamma